MGSRTTDYRKRKAEAELSSDESSSTSSERCDDTDTQQGGSADLGTNSQVGNSPSSRHSDSLGDTGADDGDIEDIHFLKGRDGGSGSSQGMDTDDDGEIGNESDDGRPSDSSENGTSSAQSDSNQDSDSDGSSSEESSEDENFVPNPGDAPVFATCPISIVQSLLAILTFTCVHNLSGNCLSDLLALISMHLPSVPDVFKSLYRFRKHFAALKTPLQYHYYCSKCWSEVTAAKDSVCQECPVGTKKQYFITMSIVGQIRNLYRRPGFTSLLKRRFERKKRVESNYEDVYDGRIYQLYVRKGFLGGNNISFVWNSDGVSIFRSSKYEVWPFYLVINELPYSERFKEENLILAGLWFGNKKPQCNIFMSKLVPDFGEIFKGIDVSSPDDPELNFIRGLTICGSCDLPATAIFLNHNQYNGYYPCWKCMVKGERSERTNNSHAFPVDNSPSRNENDYERKAKEAQHTKTVIDGIKGLTVLAKIVPHCYRATSFDIMHLAYQGISKRLMELWFEPHFRDEQFSLRPAINVVSDYITAITPPSYFQRLPRSLLEHLAYWKASEFKAWMLYYSLPVLKEIMTPEYFQHYMLLVCGIQLLNQDSVLENDIDNANMLLREYVTQFQVLYGYQFVTMNFHALLHLPECVREYGPNWTVSTFRFENFNGTFKKHVHGTRYAETQICSYLSTIVNVHSAVRELPDGNCVKEFCQKLLSRKKIKTIQLLESNLYSAGKCYKPKDEQRQVIRDSLDDIDVFGNLLCFTRLLKGRILYQCRSSSKARKTLSFCVSFDHDGSKKFGIVDYFVKALDCNCAKVCSCGGTSFAIISVFEQVGVLKTTFPEVELTYISECVETRTQVAVPITAIQDLCILVVTPQGKTYVSRPINIVEVE